MQIFRMAIWGYLILFSCCVSAADVYKWKDKNGSIHFGDQRYAPSHSDGIELKGRHRTNVNVPPYVAREPNRFQQPESESLPKLGVAPAGISAVQIRKCAAYARAMADSYSDEQSTANANKIKAECPKTGFSCVTYTRRPEANKCEPFVMRDGDKAAFFKHVQRALP